MLRKLVPVLLTLALVGAACSTSEEGGGGGGGGGGEKGTLLIGFPADLSDIYAYYDQPMQEGAQFAIDEINEAGGVLGYTLELKTIDMRNDVAEGTKATQQLIDEGAVYLIGTTGDGILAEGAAACGAGIPISTGDGTSPTLVGDMGDCAFQILMSDNVQGATLADYAIQQGYKNAYVITSSEIPYTANLGRYFPEAFQSGGGAVVATDEYKIGSGDYSAVVTKIANASPTPDVIFTPMFVPDTQVFLRQLRQAGVTTAVVSTDGNLDPSLAEAGEKALDGFTFSASACPPEGDPDIQAFFAAYSARYGKDPSSVVAALGYDEMYVLKTAIESANGVEPSAIIQALSNVSYSGVTGAITMDPATRRAQKSAALVQMDGTTFTCLGQPGYPSFVPEV
jgi:branched-chain amino acid transport system substrate-binding protein